MVRRFELPFNRGVIAFSENALHHMYQHAQTNWFSKESGGQLFSSSPEGDFIDVNKATGPHFEDKRTRTRFNPCTKKANRDRIRLFQQGLHPIGLWHTHPEAIPMPSGYDRSTTFEYLEAFEGDMDGFLLVILGNTGNPLNITVWVALEGPKRGWYEVREKEK